MFTAIFIVLILILVVSGIYFFPVSRIPFNELYAEVPEEIRHFPYLNRAEEYTGILEEFFNGN